MVERQVPIPIVYEGIEFEEGFLCVPLRTFARCVSSHNEPNPSQSRQDDAVRQSRDEGLFENGTLTTNKLDLRS